MSAFTLPRTGFPDLVFEGALMTEQCGAPEDAKTGNRRHEIAVYQSDDGEVIVAIHFHSEQADELSDDFVEVVNRINDVEEVLSLYQPGIHYIAESSNRRNDDDIRITRELTRRYDLQVDAILRDLVTAKPAVIPGE